MDEPNRKKQTGTGRGRACWRCHHKKVRCDGQRPCRRCVDVMPDACRDFYVWGPMEKAKPIQRWKKPSPINVRGAKAEIKKLDAISRKTIEEYVNEGVLEEECVFDFAHRESMRTVLSNAAGEAQTDEDVDAVISAGRAYLRNLPLGRSGFSSRGEHQFACNVQTAQRLSRESVASLDTASTNTSEAGGAPEPGSGNDTTTRAGTSSSSEDKKGTSSSEDKKETSSSDGDKKGTSSSDDDARGGGVAGGEGSPPAARRGGDEETTSTSTGGSSSTSSRVLQAAATSSAAAQTGGGGAAAEQVVRMSANARNGAAGRGGGGGGG
mmetsp:Transcript_13957/g.32862  ORF Transcript_13957/g.32862 Transcript_13957/m.32862 type:complete len:323 (-) Transcript_13957:197-1165(-)